MKNIYLPEGSLIGTPENEEYVSSIAGLERAFLCELSGNLHRRKHMYNVLCERGKSQTYEP